MSPFGKSSRCSSEEDFTCCGRPEELILESMLDREIYGKKAYTNNQEDGKLESPTNPPLDYTPLLAIYSRDSRIKCALPSAADIQGESKSYPTLAKNPVGSNQLTKGHLYPFKQKEEGAHSGPTSQDSASQRGSTSTSYTSFFLEASANEESTPSVCFPLTNVLSWRETTSLTVKGHSKMLTIQEALPEREKYEKMALPPTPGEENEEYKLPKGISLTSKSIKEVQKFSQRHSMYEDLPRQKRRESDVLPRLPAPTNNSKNRNRSPNRAKGFSWGDKSVKSVKGYPDKIKMWGKDLMKKQEEDKKIMRELLDLSDRWSTKEGSSKNLCESPVGDDDLDQVKELSSQSESRKSHP